MSQGLYSITTRASGTILTAAIYNADHQNHVTNQNPLMTGAYSDSVAQFQTQTNPGGVGSESLAGSLAGELERLRYVLAKILGTTFWYDYAHIQTFVNSLADATNGGLAFSTSTGAITANLKPSDLLTKATPTSSDSILLMDAAASNVAKTATVTSVLGAAKQPTAQIFTSSSGTYTTPTGAVRLRVRIVGGGGGGGGASATSAAGGGTGGNTTFGTSLLTANGGVGGTIGNASAAGGGGAGGSTTVGAGPSALVNLSGGNGSNAGAPVNGPGGMGAVSPFGGAGPGGNASGSGAAAVANSGSGGGAAGGGSNYFAGGAGGAGGYIEAIIGSPNATYNYAVGAAGAAGTGTTAGGAGGSGYIVVEEYYI